MQWRSAREASFVPFLGRFPRFSRQRMSAGSRKGTGFSGTMGHQMEPVPRAKKSHRLMDFKNLRWASVGTAFALFAAVDLLVLLLTPVSERGVALVPPTVAGVVVLLTLPSLLALFER